MQCLDASELMSLRLDQDLVLQDEEALQAHLAECADCRQAWALMQRAHALFDDVVMRAPPLDLTSRVMARVRQRDRKMRLWRTGIVAFVGLLVTAALAIAPIMTLVNTATENPLVVNALLGVATRVLGVAGTLLGAMATFARALATRPGGLYVVGYLVLAAGLLVGWLRIVMRPPSHAYERVS